MLQKVLQNVYSNFLLQSKAYSESLLALSLFLLLIDVLERVRTCWFMLLPVLKAAAATVKQ